MKSDTKKVAIYDTTLRDGAQGEGVSFSGAGKIRVAKCLDEFGIDYIEGGFAASNPKDMEFFREIKKENLRHAKIAAFGSTRRANTPVGEDAGVKAMMEADTPVVTFFGKSWLLHVKEVLKTTPEENLAMIADTVRFFKERGKEVIYDAEHFFDGYKDNAEYALATIKAARDAGADIVVPCDTNGGSLPFEVAEITKLVDGLIGSCVGIHAHNDSELAVANSLEAVRMGAVHVQGTINGYGERAGNANLCSIIPDLILKMGRTCLRPDALKQLREVSTFVDDMANLRPNRKMPFVGDSAFAHKAGMHVNAVQKVARSFEHIEPELVGNKRRVLISELSGASNILLKAVEMGFHMDKSAPEVKDILRELERLEKQGYEFESAEASFKLLVQKVLKAHKPFFTLEGFSVVVQKPSHEAPGSSNATIKLTVNGESELTAGEGDGPVDALNQALRKALTRFYPAIRDVSLTDYRVRILDPEVSTAAKTQVLIESTDGHESWGTVGVSGNIIEASWEALVDSVEYKLFLDEQKKSRSG